MYQRHWRSVHPRGLAEAQSTADTEDLRMVCGTSHERNARDGGTGYARCGGGCLRRKYGDCPSGYKEFDGVLRVAKEVAGRGRGAQLEICQAGLMSFQCGITDFSFNDLLKPTHDRLVKIFSYVINFVRFRESQTATIDEHFNKAERTKSRIETLYLENQDMESRLDEMRRERKSMDLQVKEKTKRNDELKQRLLELKKGQERVAERLERVRGEKGRLTGVLEEKTERCLGVRQESEKLRPYVLQSPAALQANLTELSENLGRDRSQIDSLEKRTRALQTSTDTFGVVANDVVSCTKVLEEVSNELHKEDEENVKAAKRRDALSERGNNVREVERTEAVLQRHLKRWLERTETVRNGSREKAQAAKEKTEELRGVHRRLTEERAEKGREMEKRRVRIEQTEKKVGRVSFTVSKFHFLESGC